MNPVLSRALAQPPRLWARYTKVLDRRPRLTKSLTSVAAAILGDALAQQISNRDKASWEYDWLRTARLAVFNAGMGVLGHEYYLLLDGRVMPHASRSPAAIAAKVGIDQLLFAPTCTAVFYFFKVATEGRPSEYAREMHEKFVTTLLAGYRLWIPAHIINFALVPNRHRILYANVMSLAGTYILSRAQAGDYTSGKAAAGQRHRHGATEVVFDGVTLKQD